MSKDASLTVEERLLTLLQHLGITHAHFAAYLPADWEGFATTHPEVITSLILAGPPRKVLVDARTLQRFSAPLLVFTGEQDPSDDVLRHAVTDHPEATLVTLSDYRMQLWADVVADRNEEMRSAILTFLERVDRHKQIQAIELPKKTGEVAGLTYHIQGSGPPLILLPLALAPSQWEPLLPILREHYCTIVIQGSALGFAAIIEARGHSTGYLNVVRNLVNEVHLQPGEEILEVGCGTGVLTRWITRQTKMAHRITGIDINAYLLREAKSLAHKEQLENMVEFREGNAEALPFPENSFDVTVAFTVMEEVDADKMLYEMIRVTKPGGRVGVLIRSVDMSSPVNLPLRPEIKTKVEAPSMWSGWGSGVGEKGCADASLYRRFQEAKLNDVKMMPQLATYAEKKRLHMLYPLFIPLLDVEQVDEWWKAVFQAETEGTAFICRPFHSAVGKKP